ncbi:VOC family protein [Carboxylicivirga sp. M1479]|uniref:VOC family protein n=1 Tax=Carboxylicivirga sp. M1479 TaxID=2594476 RepID=UPI0011788142|nr:VOC family protein [Carboxylicivirga sp. M1479]TRX70432.1 VOC family protein [Carboxylicivirga sp. M1479]
MATINPYVTFQNGCEEAFNFYKKVFGGDFEYIGRFKDMPAEFKVPDSEVEKIMHISLRISKDTVLMGSDSSAAFGPPVKVGNNISISINTESESEAKDLFKGLANDGQVNMPLEKTFWGSLFGVLTDQYGINWMVNYDYEQSK